MNIEFHSKVESSLTKVFLDTEPKFEPECCVFTALKNEIVSFQLAYSMDCYYDERMRVTADLEIISPINEIISVRNVECVPSQYPAHPEKDDNYIRTSPGLYPDLLTDISDNKVLFQNHIWKSLWFDIDTGKEIKSGKYPIKIIFKDENTGKILSASETYITLYDEILPDQTLIRTEWFHADCLADYYNVCPLSKKHWELIENFIRYAVKHGINMILTPQFTPPLDTKVGGERTTIQLVEVEKVGGTYKFDFTNLKRWVDLCSGAGVRYFEMSHLFTQWGAKSAPKIMATVDGKYKKIFGWDTPATGDYTAFLSEYLPQLTAKLKEWKIEDKVYFHISDEPNEQNITSYRKAKDSISEYLKGFKIIDALSSYEFYKKGLVKNPICSTDHIEPFIENGVKNMWTYYCTGEFRNVSNRFFSMPSSRNRIYGVQLYKYNIEGVLHWGYNFYNSQNSTEHINPYLITDAGGIFPSGDAFMVYPGENGYPEGSIRLMVQYEAMTDLRAFKLLEKLTSRKHVMELIEEDLSQPVSFEIYPKSDCYILKLRNKVNSEINRITKQGCL